MFFILLFLLLAGAYIYWKFSTTSDPKALLKSPMSIAAISSITFLTICYLIVEQLPTPKPVEVVSVYNPQDSVRDAVKHDLKFEGLNDYVNNLAYQHEFITTYMALPDYWELSDGHHYKEVEKLQEWYTHQYSNGDTTLGAFGLGIIHFLENDYDESLNWLNKISQRSIPYLNYYLGKIYESETPEQSDEYFWKELETSSSYFGKTVGLLIIKYTRSKNYTKLYDLLNYGSASQYFSYSLRRQTYLYDLQPVQYFIWSLGTIFEPIKLMGLMAALAIAAVWLIYLIRLDIFNPDKIVYFILMLFSGMLSVLGVLLIIDMKNIFLNWEMDGSFFGDLFYAIFAIGVPEELVKIFPFILLALFTKVLKEPIDYIIYASASALGFAFVENLLYFQDVAGGIIHGRAYMSVVGHMMATSIAAYGLVISRFKNNAYHPILAFAISFLTASVVHGLYDFFLFQKLVLLFILFFIFIVQVWIIMINNSLNNSSFFDYKMVSKAEGSRLFLTLALTFILGIEYIMVGWDYGPTEAHDALVGSISSAGLLIVFFGSSLSTFNLVKGYWRDVYFSSREKRGYGTLPQSKLLTSWFLLNSIKAHNYVGIHIYIENDPYNPALTDLLAEPVSGIIIDRVILYEENDPDPHWFLVKLDSELPLADRESSYALIKLRYQNESLKYEDGLYSYFRTIPDLQLLQNKNVSKNLFDSHRWIKIGKFAPVNT